MRFHGCLQSVANSWHDLHRGQGQGRGRVHKHAGQICSIGVPWGSQKMRFLRPPPPPPPAHRLHLCQAHHSISHLHTRHILAPVRNNTVLQAGSKDTKSMYVVWLLLCGGTSAKPKEPLKSPSIPHNAQSAFMPPSLRD